jgi:hypothetical protein
MKKKNRTYGMRRRQFLQKTSAFAATAMFLPLE